MRKIILALTLLSSPALAQPVGGPLNTAPFDLYDDMVPQLLAMAQVDEMTPAQMAAMGIGPAIQNRAPAKPLNDVPVVTLPTRVCLAGLKDPLTCKMITITPCEKPGQKACRARKVH